MIIKNKNKIDKLTNDILAVLLKSDVVTVSFLLKAIVSIKKDSSILDNPLESIIDFLKNDNNKILIDNVITEMINSFKNEIDRYRDVTLNEFHRR